MYDQPDDQQQRTRKAIADLLYKLNPPKEVATSTEAGDIPSVVPGPMPERMPIPEAMRSLPPGPAPTAPVTPAFNPTAGVMPSRVPGMPTVAPMNMDRRGVPVPAIEGEKGGPKPYTRDRAERFDYYNNGILPPDKMRAAELEYQASRPTSHDADPDKPGLQKLTLGARLKAGLVPGLVAGLQGIAQASRNPRNNWRGVLAGGAGGFGAGLAAGAINPEAGSSYVFDQTQRPALEAEEAKQKADEDRALLRQKELGQMVHLGAQTKLNEAQAENIRTDNQLAESRFKSDQEMKRAQLAIADYKAKHPGRIPYRDADGLARDPLTHQVVTDPTSGEPVKLPAPNKGAAFGGLSGVGIFNRETGEVTTPAEKPDKPDTHYASGVEGAIKQHSELKSKAVAADAAYEVAADTLAKSKDKPADLQASVQSALARREAAMQALNAHALGVNQAYGDQLEGGIGAGGFGYVKRKAGATRSGGNQSAPRATVAPDFVDRVMGELGVDRATALKRIQNSGIQVQ